MVGRTVGVLEGDDVGNGVGYFPLYVGSWVGESVGYADGEEDGKGVGLRCLYVGSKVGSTVGATEGDVERISPGLIVGKDVGDAVG